MKKVRILFVVAILATVVFSGCDKYEEGPTLTFSSNVKRITGDWKITKNTKNGVAETYNVNDHTKINSDGTLVATYYTGSIALDISGTWKFLNDDVNLEMTTTYLSYTSTLTYTIKRLSSSELFMERQDGNDSYRVELKKQ